MKSNILYFEDDADTLECFQLMLESHFNVIGCQNVVKYPEYLKEFFPHAVLIDVHMPIMGGFELYEKIISDAAYNGCPIIFISGDQSDKNKIQSLERGGVDFFSRELSSEEIILRLNNKIQLFLKLSSVIELGNLKVDVQALRVSINKVTVDVTLIEMRMLLLLLRAFPQAVTKDQVLKSIWGDNVVKSGTINTHLTNMRSKLQGWSYSIKVKEENILIQKN